MKTTPSPSILFFSLSVLFLLGLSANVDAQFTKKSGYAGGGGGVANSLNADWYYNWGLGGTQKYTDKRSNFIPMFWNGGSVNNKNIQKVIDGGNTHVLGFNEPERKDQANMSVNKAIEKWEQITAGFEGTNIQLISPAVSDNGAGQQWLVNFMNKVRSSNKRKVDAVAFHWYGASTPNNIQQTAQNFLSRVSWYHNTFNKPVWITEFGIHDWGNKFSTQAIANANRKFLEIVIPQLESRNYVKGYAIYPWFNDTKLLNNGNLTALGEEYTRTRYSDNDYNLGGNNRDDIVHLSGGTLRNKNKSKSSTIEAIDALDETSRLAGDGIIRVSNWAKIREGAILDANLGGTLDLTGANTSVNGMLNHSNGTIQLPRGRGVETSGSGMISVSDSAKLQLGGSREGAVGLSKVSLEYKGGTIDSDEGYQFIMGDVNVTEDTVHTGEGTTFMRGNLSGTGKIIKQGAGTLNIEGNSASFSGGIVIEEGMLNFNSILNGDLEIESNGTMRGGGTVRGNLVSRRGNINLYGNGDSPNSDRNSATAGVAHDLVQNGSFQETKNTPLASGDSILFSYWSDEDNDGQIGINLDDQNNVPGDNGNSKNHVYKLQAGSNDTDFFYQNLDHAWSSEETLTVSLNATETPWQSGEGNQNSIVINIQHEGSKTIWSQTIDLDGTWAKQSGNSDWDDSTLYEFTINPSVDFQGSSEGSKIRIGVEATEGQNWIDNLSVMTDFGVTSSSLPEDLNVLGDYIQEPGGNLELSLIDHAELNQLHVRGDMKINGGRLRVNNPRNLAFRHGDSFQLFTFQQFQGEFDSIQLPALSSGMQWDTSGLMTTGTITAVAVPEPSTLLLMLLGMSVIRSGRSK